MDLSDAFADWEPITDVKGSVREDVKKLRDLPMVRVCFVGRGRQWSSHGVLKWCVTVLCVTVVCCITVYHNSVCQHCVLR